LDVDGGMKKHLLFTLLFTIIMVNGLIVVSSSCDVATQDTTHGITRVQSLDGGAANYGRTWYDNQTHQEISTSASNQTTAGLAQAPKEGDVLIAAIGVQAQVSNAPAYFVDIASIVQEGVIWTRQVRKSYWGWSDCVEIWLGTVAKNAASTITFNAAVNLTKEADYYGIEYAICEYTGVAMITPLDQSAVSNDISFSAYTSTGQTELTTKPNELWIGAIFSETSVKPTNALNNFTLIGGDPTYTDGRISTCMLERIVDEKGQAWSGTTTIFNGEQLNLNHLGCIATFYASNQTSDNPDATMTPNHQTSTGTQLKISCQSTTSSIIKVNIQGSLTNNRSGISNEPIGLAYSVNNGETWTDLSSVTTDNNGDFTVMWNPAATGNYMIKAIWEGNSQYPAMDTTINFAITPTEEPQSSFSVNSNSTISALSFDTTDKQLSFTVSGEPGSTGYVEVYVPKTLMNDTSGLEVRLDGNKLEYNLADQGDSWSIIFTYNHSSHQVIMDLASQSRDGSFDTSFVGWILAAAILIPLITSVVLAAIKKTSKSQLVQMQNV
jgi:hypothetical protein